MKIQEFGYMARRRKRRSGRSRAKLRLMDVLLGAGIVTITEPTIDAFLDKAIPLQVAGFDMKDVVKIVGGLWLSKKSGLQRYAGMALAIIGSRNLVRSFVGSRLSTNSGTNGW